MCLLCEGEGEKAIACTFFLSSRCLSIRKVTLDHTQDRNVPHTIRILIFLLFLRVCWSHDSVNFSDPVNIRDAWTGNRYDG